MKKKILMLLVAVCMIPLISSCGKKSDKKHVHNFSGNYNYDKTKHWNSCSCGEKSNEGEHLYGEWIIVENSIDKETKKRICSVCAYEDTEEHTHNYSTTYGYDSENHWKECSCGKTKDLGKHNIVEGDCTICDYFEYSKGLDFTLLSDDTYEVSGIGTCRDKYLKIPDTYNDKAVTSIGESAFYECDITGVTIPNSVTKIKELAFYGCTSLTKLIIGSGVTYIDYDAFYCQKLVEIYNLSSLNITIGYSDEYGELGLYAKVIHTSLEESNITKTNDGYLFIYDNTDYYLVGYEGNATKLTLPNDINGNSYIILKYAFYGCSNLTSITIPNNVINIGEYAFDECSSLGYNEYDNAYYLGNDINPYLVLVKAKSTSISSCKINENTKIIYSSAFNDCSSLTSITIPNSVTSIGDGAFYCYSLENVYYEGSIEKWCNIKFVSMNSNPMCFAPHFNIKNSNNEWKEVTEIEIPNTITRIGDYQFYGFNNVTSITIPNSVTIIGYSAFDSCKKLTSITIPNSVTSIEDWAFSGSGLTSITIPNSVTSINNGTFCDCRSLTSITIPNSVTSIGYMAFNGCSNIASITIPNSVIDIEDSVFDGCSSLVYNESDNAYYLGNDINPYLVLVKAKSTSISSCKINENTKIIYSSAFKDCSSLTSITIPNGVTSIKSSTFKGCSSLTSITIPNGVTSIGSYAFDGCSSLTSITIPNSVIYISNASFRDCSSLTSITIPNSVMSIDSEAFNTCTNLSSVYYKGTKKEWDSINIDSYNNTSIIDAEIYYYSETKPLDTTNKYWHYVDGVITNWE